MTSPQPLRVVQWTTGNVARQALHAMVKDDRLELVGVYAHSKDKVGRDAGDLAGLGRFLGVAATDDIDTIIGLKPDCVVYMPLHPDVDDMARLLEAGINVATTASFITGRAYGEDARARLELAAQTGGASLFGSGVNPGFAEYITAVASTVSRDVEYVRVLESFDIGLWAGDANQDELGWGRPQGDPGHAADIEKATAPSATPSSSWLNFSPSRSTRFAATSTSPTPPLISTSLADRSRPEQSPASRPSGSARPAGPMSSR